MIMILIVIVIAFIAIVNTEVHFLIAQCMPMSSPRIYFFIFGVGVVDVILNNIINKTVYLNTCESNSKDKYVPSH